VSNRVRDLAGAEVMTWDANRVPLQVAESQGPLRVGLRGEVVKLFPWYSHPEVRQGVLYILDVAHGGRLLAEYQPGTWDEVIHDVRLAGLY
jgi:hypothetical protein